MRDMKIKEKARVAWEQTKRIEIVLEDGDSEHGYIQYFAPSIMLHGVRNEPIEYDDITAIRFVDVDGKEVEDEPVAMGQFAYTEPGADRKVVGLVCDSALVNSEGKLVVYTYWPGGHHIAGMAGRLDMDFAESIFGYHGMTTVYEVLVCGGYAYITFTIDDPCEENQVACNHEYEVMAGYMNPGFYRCKHCGDELPPKRKQDTEPHDIAKERWMTYKGVGGIEVRQKCDGHEPSLATVRYGTIDAKAKLVATDAQIKLMTAGPELVDRARELLNIFDGCSDGNVHDRDGYLPSGMLDKAKSLANLLRKLSVPNVASWYKEDE